MKNTTAANPTIFQQRLLDIAAEGFSPPSANSTPTHVGQASTTRSRACPSPIPPPTSLRSAARKLDQGPAFQPSKPILDSNLASQDDPWPELGAARLPSPHRQTDLRKVQILPPAASASSASQNQDAVFSVPPQWITFSRQQVKKEIYKLCHSTNPGHGQLLTDSIAVTETKATASPGRSSVRVVAKVASAARFLCDTFFDQKRQKNFDLQETKFSEQRERRDRDVTGHLDANEILCKNKGVIRVHTFGRLHPTRKPQARPRHHPSGRARHAHCPRQRSLLDNPPTESLNTKTLSSSSRHSGSPTRASK